MSDTGSDPQDPSSLWKLVNLDPSKLAMLVTMVTGIAATFGVTVAEEKAKGIAILAFLVITVGMQAWQRRRVIPAKKVLAYVPDPTDPEPAVVPGAATTSASTADVMAAVRTPGQI